MSYICDFTNEEMQEALEMYYSGKYTMTDIAKWFGVSLGTITNKISYFIRIRGINKKNLRHKYKCMRGKY